MGSPSSKVCLYVNWLIQARGKFLVDLGTETAWTPQRAKATRFKTKAIAEEVELREFVLVEDPVTMKIIPDLRPVGDLV